MKKQDFTTVVRVNQPPLATFAAIGNVRGWWSENIEGCTDKPGCTFFYHYQDIHRCRIKVVEAIPGEKVVWLVEDNFFKFTRDKSEWKGTRIIFEITAMEDGAAITFIHEGLIPHYECFEVCRDAWTHFMQDSLRSLIETGQGQPSPKDGSESFDTDLVRTKGLNSEDLVLSFEVDQTPQQVFDAINDVRGWWGRGVQGGTSAAGDEFVYRHANDHVSRHRLTEVVPGKRVAWLTTESRLNFVDNKNEWTGTTISFDIREKNGKTAVEFTHGGLTPVLECYGACAGAWDYYVKDSLRKLIETGEGEPDAE